MTETEEVKVTSQEKLVQAAKRLERLLFTQSTYKSTEKDADAVIQAATTLIHSNPAKIVKRWLGTSSGTAANATLADVAFVAKTMLNPMDSSATGRDLLMQLAPTVEEMETEVEAEETQVQPKFSLV